MAVWLVMVKLCLGGWVVLWVDVIAMPAVCNQKWAGQEIWLVIPVTGEKAGAGVGGW